VSASRPSLRSHRRGRPDPKRGSHAGIAGGPTLRRIVPRCPAQPQDAVRPVLRRISCCRHRPESCSIRFTERTLHAAFPFDQSSPTERERATRYSVRHAGARGVASPAGLDCLRNYVFDILKSCRRGDFVGERSLPGRAGTSHISDRNPDALRGRRPCASASRTARWVLSENSWLGPVKRRTRSSAVNRAFRIARACITPPRLGRIADAIEDYGLVVERRMSARCRAARHAARRPDVSISARRYPRLAGPGFFLDVHRVMRAAANTAPVRSPPIQCLKRVSRSGLFRLRRVPLDLLRHPGWHSGPDALHTNAIEWISRYVFVVASVVLMLIAFALIVFQRAPSTGKKKKKRGRR